MPKRVEVGIVTSDKTPKTRRVEIPRLVRHARYGKFLRQKTVCTVHDEEDESRAGDLVEIIESRPLSRTKRWRLVRVLEKGRGVLAVAKRAAAREAQQPPEAPEPAAENV
ncbi:MAG: 30S ribosomal protein S17 [Thermoguttaceae bacterium]|jgi:small subunit ribosomal protein S17